MLASLLAALLLASGWLGWRGPAQNGSAEDSDLPATLGAPRWTYPLAGRGTPVILDGRLFVMGYQGEGADLRELLVALDAETGKKLWSHTFNDFLSDTIYDRYAIGAPAIDPDTGNVYALSVAGLFSAFTRDGKLLWQHSLMETIGRLTFPNSRTGAPVVDGELVIVRGVTANWGAQSPPRDRFYAFDKRTGAHVWASTPGEQPRDNSFSTPVLDWDGGKRVLYAGTGCGHVVAVNARTGEPLWKFPAAQGGVNASVLLAHDRIIAVHGTENRDQSTIGRMVAVKRDGSTELWRAELSAFSSSPVLAGRTIYQVTDSGELVAVDLGTGKILWTKKLGRDQIHASPVFADGKLYVPMNDGTLHVIRPGNDSASEISVTKLEGNCLGAPAVWNGKLYVITTRKLYAFGAARAPPLGPLPAAALPRKPGPAALLEIRPSELWLAPGESVQLSARALDAAGDLSPTAGAVNYAKWIPPTAKVKSYLDAEIDAAGRLTAGKTPSAGAFEATSGALKGHLRGRILAVPPFTEDFESFSPSEVSPDGGAKFAWPPLPWIGARLAWEVREVGGAKVLAKTLDKVILQRSRVFMGHPDSKGYTVAADVMSDGNRRTMGDVGVINQRYLVALKGNWQQLEVSSNDERLKVSAPFAWKPGVWYRLAVRVDARKDGASVVRAKAWKQGEPEPGKWLLEVPHPRGHDRGAPGLYGFAPDSLFRVYVDNVAVTENAK